MTRLLGHYIAIGVSYTRDNKYYDAQDPGDGRMGQFTHSITSVHNPAQTTEARQSDDSVRFSSSDDMQMHGHNINTLHTTKSQVSFIRSFSIHVWQLLFTGKGNSVTDYSFINASRLLKGKLVDEA